MPQQLGGTILKLIIFSLVAGMVMSFFDITPQRLIENFGETVREIFQFVVDAVEWGARYVLLGAVIVVPIWLIKLLFDALGRRGRGGGTGGGSGAA
ncbi:MAG: integrase [Alphaproteobacteria bacterium]|nr:integrase [Alphaproteobacteria bacterium]